MPCCCRGVAARSLGGACRSVRPSRGRSARSSRCCWSAVVPCCWWRVVARCRSCRLGCAACVFVPAAFVFVCARRGCAGSGFRCEAARLVVGACRCGVVARCGAAARCGVGCGAAARWGAAARLGTVCGAAARGAACGAACCGAAGWGAGRAAGVAGAAFAAGWFFCCPCGPLCAPALSGIAAVNSMPAIIDKYPVRLMIMRPPHVY